MQDYQSNSKKAKGEEGKDAKPAAPEEKNLEKVIVGDAVIRKKGLGRKAKEMVVDADFKGAVKDAVHHAISDVLFPSAKNLLWDLWSDVGRRTIYRGSGPGPRGLFDPRSLVQRITYNSPVQRSTIGYPRDPRETRAIAQPIDTSARVARSDVEEVLVGSKEEADLVLEKMTDIIEAYDIVSVHDLKEMLGHPKSHVDKKWGWVSVADVPIRQSREGWLMAFSSPQPIHTT